MVGLDPGRDPREVAPRALLTTNVAEALGGNAMNRCEVFDPAVMPGSL